MNTKHTPGPWMESGFEVWSPLNGKRFGKVVADLCWADGTSDEARANARLIAAAPELMEALNDAVAAYDDGDLDGAIVNRLRAAIAKATDETL